MSQYQTLKNASTHWLHWDTKPLITTVWVWPSTQFLIHWVLHPSNLHLCSLETRMLCRTVSSAFWEVDDVSLSYLIHHFCKSIIEGNQVTRPWLAFSEASLFSMCFLWIFSRVEIYVDLFTVSLNFFFLLFFKAGFAFEFSSAAYQQIQPHLKIWKFPDCSK